MGKRIRGSFVAERIYENVKVYTEHNSLKLMIFSIGDDKASRKYINSIIKKGQYLGVDVCHINFPLFTPNEEIEEKIKKISLREDIDAVMLEMSTLNKNYILSNIIDLIPTEKDVDCLKIENRHRLLLENTINSKLLIPSTVKAVLETIYSHDLTDYFHESKILVIGRSYLLGKPLVDVLMKLYNATITIAHSKTDQKHLSKLIEENNIVISATGANQDILFNDENKILIDCGTRVENGKLKGDFNFKIDGEFSGFYNLASDGIGTITTACLFDNLVVLKENKKRFKKNG